MSLRLVRILLLVLIALEVALLVFGPQTKEHLPAIKAAVAAVDKPDWDDDASMGIRYTAWFNLPLLVVLLGTAQWWAKPSRKAKDAAAEGQPSPKNTGKEGHSLVEMPVWTSKGLFFPLVLLAVITCIAVRVPLASKSLWWDESWVVLQVTHGKWRPDTKKPGQLKFTEHDWKRCAFYYQKPTNHVPMSLAQKASFKIWNALSDTKRGDFSELAARMPALIASAAAVLLLALLMRQWGYPGAGAVAAFLLALHPWYIRYGVDARAYALVVPLCIAGMFAITRIFQTRGHNVLPWVAWGTIEFVWLWVFPNAAVIDITLLNLVVVAGLLFVGVKVDKQIPWKGFLSFLVTNICAAMAFIQMFLPNAMQLTRWVGKETVSQPLTEGLLKSTLSQLVFGVEYAWPQTVETFGLVSSQAARSWSSFAGGMTILLSLLVILGGFHLAISITRFIYPDLRNEHAAFSGAPAVRRLILLSPVVSTVTYMALVGITGMYFYPRFIIAVLPCLLAIICLLVAEALKHPQSTNLPPWLAHTRRGLAILLALALAIQVFPFWKAQITLLTSRPYAPLRNVAEYIATQENLLKERLPLVVCYGHGHETLPVYLPTVLRAVSKSELEKYMAQARTEGRWLYVIQGHSGHNRGLIPDGFELLDDSSKFTEVKAFTGIEPEFYYRVYEMNLPSQ